MDVHPTKNVSIGIDPYPYIIRTILQPPRQRRLHVLRPCLRRLAPVLLRAKALLRRAQAPPEVAGFASGRGEWEGGNPKRKGIVIYIYILMVIIWLLYGS